ncbi:transcriptional regulator FeaR [Halomonas ramblicola]|uniref:transcriptional regulator FeaR n=1 Tax=Halomonas ramblicola TaxID=747349 RepID=UPI0025B4D48A|nr:transcriptional regulator FeaR [Halomonas ramblicola]MDN3522927.1 transcriptional regulator FeaR [Halomonas ramblicola]
MQVLDRGPQEECFESWLGGVNDICGPFAARALGRQFDGSIQRIESSLELATVSASHVHAYRTDRELSGCDGKPYFYVFQAQGCADMEQGENRAAMSPGDIVLIDSTRPCNFYYDGLSSQMSVIVPRELVDPHLRVPRTACGTKVPAGSIVASMANRLLQEAIKHQDLSHGEGEAILESIVTLMRPMLTGRYSENDQHDRVLDRAMIYIDRHIGDSSLSSEQIAKEVGTSPRTLYRAFAGHGHTVAQYIRDRRLELFASRIRQSSGKVRLAIIGSELGFSDPSHLSTAFKAKFGMPPREYLRQFHEYH